jgi:hypothetical protein
LKIPKNSDTMTVKPDRVPNVFSESLEQFGVEYRQVMPHKEAVTEDGIITALAGGDRTSGSCASVGLAYAGQKCGYDVLDFRGGASRKFFSNPFNLDAMTNLPGLVKHRKTARNYATAGNQLLKQVENGKEYYFVCCRHAAVVRRTDDGILQYLELQSPNKSGWTNFDGNPRYTLSWRFGCPSASGMNADAYMVEVDSFKNCKEFPDILGYLNTAEAEQKKGSYGRIR